MSQAEVSRPSVDIPPPGHYRISPAASAVTIGTRHLFGLGAVRATIALRDAAVSVVSPVTGSVVRATAAVATFESGNGARDAAVLSGGLLDAEAYPSLTFVSTAFDQEPGNPGEWRLRGELTARGVTRPVEARVTGLTVGPGGASFRATAQLSVDRYAFGITGYRGLAARRLTIGLDLLAENADQPERAGRR
jgi:polyisoprenoid-binding protein YceI